MKTGQIATLIKNENETADLQRAVISMVKQPKKVYQIPPENVSMFSKDDNKYKKDMAKENTIYFDKLLKNKRPVFIEDKKIILKPSVSHVKHINKERFNRIFSKARRLSQDMVYEHTNRN